MDKGGRDIEEFNPPANPSISFKREAINVQPGDASDERGGNYV